MEEIYFGLKRQEARMMALQLSIKIWRRVFLNWENVLEKNG
jgi:hypothetical protein